MNSAVVAACGSQRGPHLQGAALPHFSPLWRRVTPPPPQDTRAYHVELERQRVALLRAEAAALRLQAGTAGSLLLPTAPSADSSLRVGCRRQVRQGVNYDLLREDAASRINGAIQGKAARANSGRKLAELDRLFEEMEAAKARQAAIDEARPPHHPSIGMLGTRMWRNPSSLGCRKKKEKERGQSHPLLGGATASHIPCWPGRSTRALVRLVARSSRPLVPTSPAPVVPLRLAPSTGWIASAGGRGLRDGWRSH